MVESVQQVFANNFEGLSFIAVVLISMIPICEARVAIPFGIATEIWGQNALHPFVSFVAAVIGGSIVSLIVLVLLKPLVSKLKETRRFKNLATKLENKFKKQTTDVLEQPDSIKNKKLNAWLSVTLFVAIPAPMTGIWSGAAVSCFTELSFFKSFSAVAVGNLIGCMLILLVCTVLKQYVFILLIASCIAVVVTIISVLLSKIKNKTKKQA